MTTKFVFALLIKNCLYLPVSKMRKKNKIMTERILQSSILNLYEFYLKEYLIFIMKLYAGALTYLF